jgi:hypothetical protein
MGGKAATDTGK